MLFLTAAIKLIQKQIFVISNQREIPQIPLMIGNKVFILQYYFLQERYKVINYIKFVLVINIYFYCTNIIILHS